MRENPITKTINGITHRSRAGLLPSGETVVAFFADDRSNRPCALVFFPPWAEAPPEVAASIELFAVHTEKALVGLLESPLEYLGNAALDTSAFLGCDSIQIGENAFDPDLLLECLSLADLGGELALVARGERGCIWIAQRRVCVMPLAKTEGEVYHLPIETMDEWGVENG